MDIEFHYNITFLSALASGFSYQDAYKISYSTQYVDDNIKSFNVFENDDSCYVNIITQSFNITMDDEEMNRIYPVFHFIPGDPAVSMAQRHDLQINLMSTTPNATIARDMLRAALILGNPHLIGIATHAFQDTWAHQNFTGTSDAYNALEYASDYSFSDGEGGKTACALWYCPVGHADVLDLPDAISKSWCDYRLKKSQINNNIRFRAAAKHVLSEYTRFNFAKLAKEERIEVKRRCFIFQKMITEVLSNNTTKTMRLSSYNNSAMKMIGMPLQAYDKNAWRDKAIRNSIKINGIFPIQQHFWRMQNYQESDWYCFQEAAKAYRKLVWPSIERLLEKQKELQARQKVH